MPPNNTNSRLFAIGDIHGCHTELCDLLDTIKPRKGDHLVFLGDYVDRGFDSCKVLSELISIQENADFEVTYLIGNHEHMMLRAIKHQQDKFKKLWLANGGLQTLLSYGVDHKVLCKHSLVPPLLKEHTAFIANMPLFYETSNYIFTHATPDANKALTDQSAKNLLWRRPSRQDYGNYRHISGKTVISGHTIQTDGKPSFISDKNLIVDTGCYYTGWLTAIELNSLTAIQVNRRLDKQASYKLT